MSFKEGTRQFWMRVGDNKCQYEFYTEKGGFRTCGAPAKHIHHIIGESETLLKGLDPEQNTGLPLCVDHHVRNRGEDLGEPDSSFHPDMGQAYKSYREWRQNTKHMNAISGRRTIDYSTSPFADAARSHKENILHGERYINGDDETDQYYIDKMVNKAVIYQAEHPEDRKPKTKPHKDTDPTKKEKRWYSL